MKTLGKDALRTLTKAEKSPRPYKLLKSTKPDRVKYILYIVKLDKIIYKV